MAAILRVKDEYGNIISIPAIKGDKGSRGESGVYVGEGEMPEECNVQINPSGDVIKIPTKLSDLINDVGFVTNDDLNGGGITEDGSGEIIVGSLVTVETDEEGNNILVIGGGNV